MPHHSTPFLTDEEVRRRNRIETEIVALEGIIFAGLSTQKDKSTGATEKYLLTVGSDNLDMAQAQLSVIVDKMGCEMGDYPIDIQLVRGIRG